MVARVFRAVTRWLPTFVELGGLACLVLAAFLWDTAAGFAALGVALILAANFASGPRSKS